MGEWNGTCCATNAGIVSTSAVLVSVSVLDCPLSIGFKGRPKGSQSPGGSGPRFGDKHIFTAMGSGGSVSILCQNQTKAQGVQPVHTCGCLTNGEHPFGFPLIKGTLVVVSGRERLVEIGRQGLGGAALRPARNAGEFGGIAQATTNQKQTCRDINHTVDGQNPIRTTSKPWFKPLAVGIYVGESYHSLGF